VFLIRRVSSGSVVTDNGFLFPFGGNAEVKYRVGLNQSRASTAMVRKEIDVDRASTNDGLATAFSCVLWLASAK
jgi:hypothetical protein